MLQGEVKEQEIKVMHEKPPLIKPVESNETEHPSAAILGTEGNTVYFNSPKLDGKGVSIVRLTQSNEEGAVYTEEEQQAYKL